MICVVTAIPTLATLLIGIFTGVALCGHGVIEPHKWRQL